ATISTSVTPTFDLLPQDQPAAIGDEQFAATVTLNGTGTKDDVWSVTATPTPSGAAATGTGAVPTGGSLTTVAGGIASTLNGAAFVATSKDGQVTITQVGGGAFTVGSKIAANGSATWPGTPATSAVTLTGAANTGDTWTLTVGNTTFTGYHVGSSSLAADAVASSFAGSANGLAGYTAFAVGSTIYITNIGGDTFDTSVTVGRSTAASIDATVSGTVQTNWTQRIHFVPRGDAAVQLGDKWTVNVDNVSYSSTATATIDSLAEIAGDLASRIPGATVDGNDLVIVSATAGATVPVGATTQYRKTAYGTPPTFSTPDVLPNGSLRPHYLRAAVELAGSFTAGDVWTVTINGTPFTYKAEELDEGSRNLRTIADKLIVEINKSGIYQAVRGGDPSAPGGDLGLPQIVIRDKSVDSRLAPQVGDDQFALDVSRGGGHIDALFDIDHSSIVSGSVPVPVAIPLSPWLRFLYSWFGIPFPTTTDQLDYVASPMLELIGPNGNVLATSRGNSHGIDNGSTTALDPFLEYTISAVGTYMIRVSSWIDWAPATRYLGVTNTFRADGSQGVVSGQSYDLIVSLGRHAVNGNAVTLAGKQITIVDGAGKGQTAMIESYNAESKTYVLDRIWSTPPNATSKFEIADLLTSSSGYRPVTDTYTVVLTGQPTDTVTVNVTPQPTRTYNSAEGFDPAADFGEANLVQVMAATPQALYQLAGAPRVGDTWYVTLKDVSSLQDKSFTHTVVAGDTLETIATDLMGKINNQLGYAVAPSGTTGFTITRTAPFSIGLSGGSQTHTAGADANSVAIQLSGAVSVGGVWTLTLDGQQYAYTALTGDTLNQVGARLASAIDGHYGYTATANTSGKISVTRQASFFATYKITPDSAGGAEVCVAQSTCTSDFLKAHWPTDATIDGKTAVIHLTGDPAQGETWALTLPAPVTTGGPSTLTYSYTTGFGDDLAAIATHLGAMLPAATFDVAVIGRVLEVSRVDNGSMTASLSISTKSPGSMTVTSQLVFTTATWNKAQTVTVMAIDNHIVDGNDALVFPPLSQRVDEIRGPVIVDGGIQVGAEQFLNNPLTLPGETNFQIPDGPISTSGSVGTLALTKVDGTAFTGLFGAGAGTVVGNADATGYTAIATVGPDVAGKTWALTLGGTTYSYTAKTGDTLFAVAANIAAAVNAGTAGFHATLNADGTLALTKPTSASFTTTLTGPGSTISSDGASGHTATTTLSGYATGVTWTLKLDAATFTYTSKTGDTLTSVAAALATAINNNVAAGFHATPAGAVLTLTKPFSSTFTSAVSTGTGSVATTDDTTRGHFATATLTAPVLVGDTWTLTLDGKPYTYTALAAGKTLGDVAAGLAAKVNAGTGFAATQARAAATITDGAATHVSAQFGERAGFDPRMNDFAYAVTFLQAGGASTTLDVGSVSSDILSVASPAAIPVSFSLTGTGGAVAAEFIGTPDQSQLASIHWTQAVVQLTGIAVVGEVWTLRLGDSTFSVNVDAANAVPSRIAQALAAQVANAGYDVDQRVSLTGDSKLVITNKGAAFTAQLSIQKAADSADTAGASTVSGVTTDVAGHTWTNAAIQVLTRGQAGNVWSFTLNGTTVSTTVRADDTIGDVVQRLANAVAGNDLTKGYAPLVSGSRIVFASDWPAGKQPATGTDYFISAVNLNFRVHEETQVDTLNVFNGNSPAPDVGFLTDSTLTGLGMGISSVIAGRIIPGGITYANLEAVNVNLGYGDNTFTVLSTHAGSTTITSGKGKDTINVVTISGHTTIETGKGNDTINVTNAGLVDQIAGLLTLDGGADADTVNVNDGADQNPNTGTLSGTTLTGLGMPTVSEVQRLFVQAIGGSYKLSIGGTATETLLFSDGKAA
ncbi:MAG: mucin9, partial [Gaiellaceae bacterium]|nr:mucin9 [Gaiellaceae bacterium]